MLKASCQQLKGRMLLPERGACTQRLNMPCRCRACPLSQGVLPAGLDKVKSQELREFITQCIAHDPDSRPDTRQLLKHPFFESIRTGKVQVERSTTMTDRPSEDVQVGRPLVPAYLTGFLQPSACTPQPLPVHPNWGLAQISWDTFWGGSKCTACCYRTASMCMEGCAELWAAVVLCLPLFMWHYCLPCPYLCVSHRPAAPPALVPVMTTAPPRATARS